jgi:hypothetical protein
MWSLGILNPCLHLESVARPIPHRPGRYAPVVVRLVKLGLWSRSVLLCAAPSRPEWCHFWCHRPCYLWAIGDWWRKMAELYRRSNLREVRILIDHRGSLGRLCKLVVSNADGSLYVLPYGPVGEFRFGRSAIPGGQTSATVSWGDQEPSSSAPHLSVHERGQVHVKVQRETVVGPMAIPPLAGLRGDHVASVYANHFGRLAPFEGTPADKWPGAGSRRPF